MLTSMNTRLLQFLSAENITQAQFADSIHVARASVSHILAGRNKPSLDFIAGTMERYPNLNIEWLISGKGKMYKSSASRDGSLFSFDVPEEEMPAVAAEAPQTEDAWPSRPADPAEFDAARIECGRSPAAESPGNEISGRRKVTKVILFFDDGTFQECK